MGLLLDRLHRLGSQLVWAISWCCLSFVGPIGLGRILHFIKNKDTIAVEWGYFYVFCTFEGNNQSSSTYVRAGKATSAVRILPYTLVYTKKVDTETATEIPLPREVLDHTNDLEEFYHLFDTLFGGLDEVVLDFCSETGDASVERDQAGHDDDAGKGGLAQDAEEDGCEGDLENEDDQLM
ncbi:hypothetical protein BGW39_005839 [Mortierella sp. 14UC]|nr:hypothetical protein BGW39_005839 [Mortierella sp. 14UC]